MCIKMHLLLMALAIPFVLSARKYDYCTIPSCKPGEHVLCKYKTLQVSETCGQVDSTYLNYKEKQKILDLHNYFSELVFGEGDLKGKQVELGPSTVKPSYLEWHFELEEIAHRWSIQCINEYAECSDVEEISFVKQLKGLIGTKNMTEELKIETILWEWYNQDARFSELYLQRFKDIGAKARNPMQYTHLVLEETQYIGCTAMRYTVKTVEEFKLLRLICNYGLQENFLEKPVQILKEVKQEVVTN